MIISVHQPQYIPWLGYFHKILDSDAFVFLENVQYKKREFQNRNKVRTKNGFIWLTVPVISKGRYYQRIKDVEIDNTKPWQRKHWEGIKFNYSGAEFFNDYARFFERLYNEKWNRLLDLNVEIVKFFLDCFRIKTPLYFEDTLNVSGEGTERIIGICKGLGAKKYLSGTGGKGYLDEDLFEKNGIELLYQNFTHPEYKQAYDGFVPNLSAIDLLFNCGEKSMGILTRDRGML